VLHPILRSEKKVAENSPEEFLIAQAAKGDQRAFERLYRAHVDRVHGLCMRMTRNAASAEDCTQLAFIQAWTALPHFERRSSFATWLHRIAVNIVLMQRRSRFELAPLALLEEMEDSFTFDTPVEVAEIEAAIDTLPDGARDVLILSGIYGYSHVEIAPMLGVAEGTCKAQLHRARRLLRERLNLEVN
jgi:RNA polymerase sigma-70 factor (ECF subfamily)